MNGECNATNVQGKNYNLHKLQGGGARAPVPHSWWRHCLSCRPTVNDIFSVEYWPELANGIEVVQGHWKWYHSKAWVRFPIRLLQQLWSHLSPFSKYKEILVEKPIFHTPFRLTCTRSPKTPWNFSQYFNTNYPSLWAIWRCKSSSSAHERHRQTTDRRPMP